MISVNDFKTGLTISVDNGIWKVIDFNMSNQEKVQLLFVLNYVI